MQTYKIVNLSIAGTKAQVLVRVFDNASIPMNENNRDYQEYLLWISQGNQPDVENA